jgi:hypothetical protein
MSKETGLSFDLEAVLESGRTRKLLVRRSDGRMMEVGRMPVTIETHGDGDALAHKLLRAVNAHDALVAACEKMWGFWHDLAGSNPGFLGKLCLQDYAQFHEAMIAMPAALALARGN